MRLRTEPFGASHRQQSQVCDDFLGSHCSTKVPGGGIFITSEARGSGGVAMPLRHVL